MNFNQGYLGALDVSTKKLSDMIYAAVNAGAWGAKLSGAGGGDCIIALASDGKKRAVEKAIKKAGGEIIKVSTDAPGVRVEQ
jgi:mevalonate kinase